MKTGFVAVIGRANAGKSTLVNVIVGEKVSIVSPKPQTTRDRIFGVYNADDCQIVFVDTPGLYKADNKLNSVMQKTVENSVDDVDLVLFVTDVHGGLTEKDVSLIKKYTSLNIPGIAVLTKTDIMPESLLLSEMKMLSDINADIIPVSARRNKNIKELIKVIKEKLPEGDKIFGDDVISDRSEKFMISEIMREKILLKFDKEIPHGVAVIVRNFKLRENGKIYDIDLDIVCERENHKAILIGKGGKALKEVSSFARADMEKFLDKKVFLTTYVKVEDGWRNSNKYIKAFGYGEEQ